MEWDETGWRIIAPTQDLSASFGACLYNPIGELSESVPTEVYAAVEQFLQLASLCGSDIPATYLFNFMGLDVDRSEMLTDVIDQHLVELETPILMDLQYEHPSFMHDSLTYRFANPLLIAEIQRRAHLESNEDGYWMWNVASQEISLVASSVVVRATGALAKN